MAYTAAQANALEQEIKLRSFDDRYIGVEEEKELLRVAITMGIDVDDALDIIIKFGNRQGIVIERAVESACQDVLYRFAKNDGKIDSKEFQDAVALYMDKTNGRVSELDVKKRLKNIMLKNKWVAKEGGFFGSKWFSAIPV